MRASPSYRRQRRARLPMPIDRRHLLWLPRPSRGLFIAISLAAIGVALRSSAGSPPRETGPNEEMLKSFRENPSVEYGRAGSTEIAIFLYDQGDAAGVASLLVPRVAEHFDLSDEAAHEVTMGSLIRGTSTDRYGAPAAPEDLDRAERHLWKGLEAAPRSWVVHEELAAFYASRECDPEGLLRVARNWGDLRDAALRLERTVAAWSGCSQLLLAALGHHPSDLELIAAVTRLTSESSGGPFGLAI